MRNVHVARTNEEAHDYLASHNSQHDNRLVNFASAPIDKDGQFAEGYEYWRDRYLGANKSIPPDFFWDRINVAGNPDRVTEKVQMLEAMGFDRILCNFSYRSLAETKEELRLLATEVIPRFQQAAVAR